MFFMFDVINVSKIWHLTYLPHLLWMLLLYLISFQISKSKSSPYFDQSSRGHPKENSKSLRNSRDKKNEEEEHQRNTDVAETTKKNGKLGRKETEIRERCIRSWNLLRNYLRWVKNYKEICISVSGRYPFSGRNPIFRPVQPERSRYFRYLNRYGMRSFLYRSRHRYCPVILDSCRLGSSSLSPRCDVYC